MIIEPDDRNVARNIPPGLAQGLNSADGDTVRAGQDRIEADAGLQELAHRPVPVELIPAGVDDPVGAHALAEHPPIAAEAIR